MKSSENPDLELRPPRSFTPGRVVRPRVIVMHTTQGSEGNTSAEDGAAYDGRRTDGTSAHYYHDPDSSVQCVLTIDTAHTARRMGNRIGIHHEMCGKAEQTPAQWSDAGSANALVRAARIAARDAKRWGIPVRWLSPDQVRDGLSGFCGHKEITVAFPEDNGTHWDPGPGFPWKDFLGLVAGYLGQTPPPPAPAPRPPVSSTYVERTRRIVNALPVLKSGATGTPVRRLQALLNVAGYRLTEDGVFGRLTEATAKSFQRAKGLTADGIVGPLTWAKLLGV